MTPDAHDTGVELEVQFHHATERAVLVSADGNREAAQWLPRSQIALGAGHPEWHQREDVVRAFSWVDLESAWREGMAAASARKGVRSRDVLSARIIETVTKHL